MVERQGVERSDGTRGSIGHALGAALRAREAAIVAGLLALSAAGWFATSVLGELGMRLGLATGVTGEGMPSESMGGTLTALAFALFVTTWVAMMVAMMLPATVPVVLLFDRWARGTTAGRASTLAFVGGYLVVWSAIGAGVYILSLSLQLVLPPGDARVGAVAGVLLALAGVYQLTPLKAVCLRHCRSPLSFLMTHANDLRGGRSGAFRVGALHGKYCVGCCWSLMLVLAVLGLMNLAWMAVVAAVVTAERLLPRGEVLARTAGAALVAIGIFLAARPLIG
jgi:predicted metal-binding membrane protein